MQAALLARDAQIQKLEMQAEHTRISAALAATPADVQAARSLISSLVREIDDCVADLTRASASRSASDTISLALEVAIRRCAISVIPAAIAAAITATAELDSLRQNLDAQQNVVNNRQQQLDEMHRQAQDIAAAITATAM